MSDTDAALAHSEPQKLHPLTLVMALVRVAPRMVGAIPALVGIGVTAGGQYVVPAIAVIAIASLIGSWLHWARFTFQIADDEIRIDSGVLSRTHRAIPFDRIQDVAIERSPLARVLGMARVKIETGAAGAGDGEEGVLDALTLADAEALRDRVRQYRSGVALPTGDNAAVTAPADDPVVYTMSVRRVLTAGLFNFSLGIFAVLFGLFQTFDDVLPFDPFAKDFWIGLLASDNRLVQIIAAHQWIAAVAGAISLLFLGIATGVIRSVIRDYGFTLTRTATGLRRQRGLTTRSDVLLPLAKVRAAKVETGPVRRRLGFYAVQFESLARDEHKQADHVIAPLATDGEANDLLALAAMQRPDASTAWHRVHPALMAGYAFVACLPVIGGLTAVSFGQPLGWIGVAIAPLFLLAGWIGWRRTAWTWDGRQLAVRSGAWRQDLRLLPASSIESADVFIGPLARRFAIATLTLGVAGGSGHSIAALREADARALRHALLSASGAAA